ncbi:MAG: ATP-binding protein, partial [Planctomycetes bacterium]|nr:ATP-binding protein [Planctomycetota bacterium]
MGVIEACKPRREVLQGDLDDAIFAANFHDVISNKKAPKVYKDAGSFFENTHPTRTLAKVIAAVFERLANKGGGTTIRLSTGFGGGKTHTLLAMWHLANNIGDTSFGTDLLPAAGRPESVSVAAVDGRAAGTDVFGRHGNLKTRSLWGELAYSFGKQTGLKAFADVDDPEKQPDEA